MQKIYGPGVVLAVKQLLKGLGFTFLIVIVSLVTISEHRILPLSETNQCPPTGPVRNWTLARLTPRWIYDLIELVFGVLVAV